jgi:hypothetical protein
VALSLFWSSVIAEPAEVAPDRDAVRGAIGTFVANVTRWDGDNVARWRAPVCPSVSGATTEQAEFIRSRVLELAASVNAPASSDKSCEANLLIALTDHPDQTWEAWRKSNPRMFGRDAKDSMQRLVDGKRPVVSWQNSALNADGRVAVKRNADRPTEFRVSDSRIRSGVSKDISSAVVVVNSSATGKATFGQLADYIAMVSLARIDPRLDPDEDLAGSSTILRLFGSNQESAPKRLTNWDTAFLKGLYRSSDPVLRQRAEIIRGMRDELAP